MSRSVRDRSPSRDPHPPGRDRPKDIARRQFKEMVDTLFRQFMREFSHAVPDTPAGKATLLEVFARKCLDHANAAPKETT